MGYAPHMSAFRGKADMTGGLVTLWHSSIIVLIGVKLQESDGGAAHVREKELV